MSESEHHQLIKQKRSVLLSGPVRGLFFATFLSLFSPLCEKTLEKSNKRKEGPKVKVLLDPSSKKAKPNWAVFIQKQEKRYFKEVQEKHPLGLSNMHTISNLKLPRRLFHSWKLFYFCSKKVSIQAPFGSLSPTVVFDIGFQKLLSISHSTNPHLSTIFTKLKLQKSVTFLFQDEMSQFNTHMTRRTKKSILPIKIHTHFMFLHYINITVYFQLTLQPNTQFQLKVQLQPIIQTWYFICLFFFPPFYSPMLQITRERESQSYNLLFYQFILSGFRVLIWQEYSMLSPESDVHIAPI